MFAVVGAGLIARRPILARVAAALIDDLVTVVTKPACFTRALVPTAAVVALTPVCTRARSALVDLVSTSGALEVVRARAAEGLACAVADTAVLAWQRVAQIQLNLTPDTSVGCNVSVTLAVAGGEQECPGFSSCPSQLQF